MAKQLSSEMETIVCGFSKLSLEGRFKRLIEMGAITSEDAKIFAK